MMAVPRPLILLVVLVSTVFGADAVSASPGSAKVSPAEAKPEAEIAFYLARGDADACGRGCNEWIAAEGKIDLSAAQRLRSLLAKLGGRRPPVYFHSPG